MKSTSKLTTTHHVVPESAGTVLVGFWRDGATVAAYRLPVIAWQLSFDEGRLYNTEPIACEALPDVWCLEHHIDGVPSWIFPEDCAPESWPAVIDTARDRLDAADRIAAARRPA